MQPFSVLRTGVRRAWRTLRRTPPPHQSSTPRLLQGIGRAVTEQAASHSIPRPWPSSSTHRAGRAQHLAGLPTSHKQLAAAARHRHITGAAAGPNSPAESGFEESPGSEASVGGNPDGAPPPKSGRKTRRAPAAGRDAAGATSGTAEKEAQPGGSSVPGPSQRRGRKASTMASGSGGGSLGAEGGPAAALPVSTAGPGVAPAAAATSSSAPEPIPAPAGSIAAEEPELSPRSGRMLVLDAMALLYRAHHASFGPGGRLTNSLGEDTSGERCYCCCLRCVRARLYLLPARGYLARQRAAAGMPLVWHCLLKPDPYHSSSAGLHWVFRKLWRPYSFLFHAQAALPLILQCSTDSSGACLPFLRPRPRPPTLWSC
jgi:hypothetical protein